VKDDHGRVHTISGLQKGEAVIWKSWRSHRVRPITKGTRHVLVMEFWDAEEKVTPRNCDMAPCYYLGNLTFRGACPKSLSLNLF